MSPKASVVAGRVVGRRDPHFHPTPDSDALQAHDAAASANVDYVRDWAAGGLEEIDVTSNGGQDLALEAV